MTTFRDIATSSLRKIRYIASGELPEPEDLDDALDITNDIIDKWRLERFMIYTINPETFTLTPGLQRHTIGPGGLFDTNRPIRIEQANIKIVSTTPNVELPLKIVEDEGWSEIVVKAITTPIPRIIYNDHNFPLSGLYFWPYPNFPNQVVLYTWNQLSSISDVDAVLSFPPGYMKALKYALAVEFSPLTGIPLDPLLTSILEDTRACIQRANVTPLYMNCDAALLNPRRTFNWLTGE